MAQARAKSGTKRKAGGKRKAAGSGRGSLWPWVASLAVVGGGIAFYDNSSSVRHFVSGLKEGKLTQTADRSSPSSAASRPSAEPKTLQKDGQKDGPKDAPVPPRPVGLAQRGVPSAEMAPDQSQTAAIIPPAPIGRPVMEASAAANARNSGEAGHAPSAAGTYQARFFLCGTAKQDDCVSSPDRFVFHGQKIRLVGIEVPDIKKPRCEAERIKASDAELRVRAFLDSGPFELRTWQGNNDEVDGHRLRDVTRNGMSLSEILVRDGLAHKPGTPSGWCG
jgi:endonuclease YncB( thermonuclease family)